MSSHSNCQRREPAIPGSRLCCPSICAERLQAEVLRQLGKRAESALIQQRLFERLVAVGDLRTWLADLPEAARSGAIAQARTLALDHDDPAAAALVLIEIGADDG